MYIQIICGIVALVYLVYRASQLALIPRTSLIRALGFEIPAPVLPIVHALTAEDVYIHWDSPEKSTYITKYVIQINNRNSGETDKSRTSIAITGLQPRTLYAVRVITINANNFLSASRYVFFKTPHNSQLNVCSSTISSILESSKLNRPYLKSLKSPRLSDASIDPIVRLSEQNSLRRFTPLHDSAENAVITSTTPTKKSYSSTRKASRSKPAAKQSDQHSHYSIEALTAELEQARLEIDDVTNQIRAMDSEFNTSKQALMSELSSLRALKKHDDRAKAALKAEIRSLESTKRSLDSQKSKKEKEILAKKDELEKIKSSLSKSERDYELLLVRQMNLEAEITAIRDKFALEKYEISAKIDSISKENTDMESKLACLSAAKSTLANGASELNAVKAERKKLLLDKNEAEKEWKNAQKELELRYISVVERYQAACTVYSQALEQYNNIFQTKPQTKQSEKISPKKSTRRSTKIQASSPVASYPLNDPRFPDASTINSIYTSLNASKGREDIDATTYTPPPLSETKSDQRSVNLSASRKFSNLFSFGRQNSQADSSDNNTSLKLPSPQLVAAGEAPESLLKFPTIQRNRSASQSSVWSTDRSIFSVLPPAPDTDNWSLKPGRSVMNFRTANGSLESLNQEHSRFDDVFSGMAKRMSSNDLEGLDNQSPKITASLYSNDDRGNRVASILLDEVSRNWNSSTEALTAIPMRTPPIRSAAIDSRPGSVNELDGKVWSGGPNWPFSADKSIAEPITTPLRGKETSAFPWIPRFHGHTRSQNSVTHSIGSHESSDAKHDIFEALHHLSSHSSKHKDAETEADHHGKQYKEELQSFEVKSPSDSISHRTDSTDEQVSSRNLSTGDISEGSAHSKDTRSPKSKRSFTISHRMSAPKFKIMNLSHWKRDKDPDDDVLPSQEESG
ncbi:hypothetical protein CANCADRAFT_140210 [Tortispora caseinolytica NRRL Y-17796]|uniref:Fibronectin type-III domain-containing protein n=1 Tax=Tortispora caseinolytica NRRL Y-17796 TaxID=767744 RepID=A0A1E4TCL6_9ASCO|nr:hypothetical protein CANCADRAFT_140210 [Tortispora caseinolytica NRRL Y-17796]